ncbi:MAG: fatty acid desaturase [Ramlibacter sp.]|nr:fatty acid desaturase [Ramlibacter sp.]
MPQNVSPLAPGQPLPHRKIIRQWLVPLAHRKTAWPVLLLLLDGALLLLSLAGTTQAIPLWAKLLCGLAAGVLIARLFIIGHDACHQSLTPHRRLNKWLGRVAFLPSLTPYSLWDVGHNVVHHGYTNLKGFDFVWAPCTLQEFRSLSPLQRLLDRVYRSGWAPGLYYMVEIWWKRMFFPARRHAPTRRPVFILDNLLVCAFALFWVAMLVTAAHARQQPVWQVLLAGLIVPLAVWFALIGFVVYVHHTHTDVAWHRERTAWSRAQPFVSTTVHLTFRRGMGALLHHIMEHTAHHVDMSIPLYRLKRAQARLETLLPGRIIVQPFSWRWYFRTARQCKLYDFERACWTDYAGRAASAPHDAC